MEDNKIWVYHSPLDNKVSVCQCMFIQMHVIHDMLTSIQHICMKQYSSSPYLAHANNENNFFKRPNHRTGSQQAWNQILSPVTAGELV